MMPVEIFVDKRGTWFVRVLYPRACHPWSREIEGQGQTLEEATKDLTAQITVRQRVEERK